ERPKWPIATGDRETKKPRWTVRGPTGSEIGETGFEPATARPPAGCATRLRHSPCVLNISERATGIEPALRAWKARVQPQHFARLARCSCYPLGRRASVGTSPASSTNPP